MFDMLVPWDALNGIRRRTAQCARGAERKRRKLAGGGGEVDHRHGFHRLWSPPGDGDLLQIPGGVDLVGVSLMAGSGELLIPDKEGLE